MTAESRLQPAASPIQNSNSDDPFQAWKLEGSRTRSFRRFRGGGWKLSSEAEAETCPQWTSVHMQSRSMEPNIWSFWLFVGLFWQVWHQRHHQLCSAADSEILTFSRRSDLNFVVKLFCRLFPTVKLSMDDKTMRSLKKVTWYDGALWNIFLMDLMLRLFVSCCFNTEWINHKDVCSCSSAL